MKRNFIVAVLLLLLSYSLAATEDEYIIGAYSQYMLEGAHETEEVFSGLGKLLSEAGYNTVLYSMSHGSALDGRLEAALRALKKYELKSIIDDWGYRTNSSIGVTAMAYGNYLKLEAEYHYDANAKTYVEEKFAHDNADRHGHYLVFRHDVGKRSQYKPELYSNGYAWICDAAAGDKAGVAFSDPIFRWKAENASWPKNLGSEFKFYPRADRENRLYVRIAMMWEDMPKDAKIAEVKLRVLKKASEDEKDPNPYLELPLTPVQPELYDTVIMNKDYSSILKDPETGAYIFEFYTSLFNLSSDIYTIAYDGNYFNHISPTLHWYGAGRLAIDYIELEDELYRAFTVEDHPMVKALDKRLRDIAKLPYSESITHLYGKDEPLQGQFAVFNKLEKHLQSRSRRLITATNILHANLQKAGGLPGYSHYELFLEQADPNIVMLDAFALQEWGAGPGTLIRWNEDLDHRLFIQNKLDNMVLNHYLTLTRLVKHSPKHKDTELFFVPQIFGEKVVPRDSREWLYFMPPLSMMKCLQLLPLCYAADGILDFAITSNREQNFPHRTDEAFNRITPIAHEENYHNPRTMEDESFLQNLAEANAKIKVYGPIIRKLNWQNAYCIDGLGKNQKPGSKIIKNMKVQSKEKTHYQGYVQCGEYLNDDDLPSIMLVNRRAIFKKGEPSLADWKVERDFENAPEQTVIITLKPDGDQAFGLYDPYLKNLYVSNNMVFEVNLAAGDGALLQVVPVPYPYTPPAPKRNWFQRLFGIK